jgi:hypothetical protein
VRPGQLEISIVNFDRLLVCVTVLQAGRITGRKLGLHNRICSEVHNKKQWVCNRACECHSSKNGRRKYLDRFQMPFFGESNYETSLGTRAQTPIQQ